MKRWTVFASVCLLGWCGIAEEEPLTYNVSLGAGVSRNDQIAISRLGIRKDANETFFKNPTGWMDIYSEISAGYWNKGADHVFVAAYSPVFIYYFGDDTWAVHPYIEAGIGIAGLSQTEIGDRDLSTAFQFEDRIGIGVRMEALDFSVRYMHYSNASITQPNDGIDLFIATVAYRF